MSGPLGNPLRGPVLGAGPVWDGPLEPEPARPGPESGGAGSELRVAVQEVAFAQAVRLARGGRYTEARDLLDRAFGEDERTAPVLDLLARVHAQCGDLDEADRLWSAAERLAPGDDRFAAGRRRVARLRRGRVRAFRPGWRTVAAGTVVVLAVGVLVGRWALDSSPKPIIDYYPVTATPRAPRAPGADGVLDRIDLRVPGVQVERDPGELSVTFRRGLFRDGGALTERGRAALNALGVRLRPYGDRITVLIIGHTDGDGGGYAENADLGTVRAGVVREALRRASRMPTERFAVATLGGDRRPHRGGAGQERNRTVTLRITPRDAEAGGS